MEYRIRILDPDRHLIELELHLDDIKDDRTELQLPAWRPGRYQLADFARNLYRLDAYGANGEKLDCHKLKKDRWEVRTKGAESLTLRYSYYAAEMTAGSSFVDGKQLYVNPVNCCVYIPGREEEVHRVRLELPEHYKVATALEKEDEHSLVAPNMQALMDGPFIASPSLQQHSFEEGGVRFQVHFQGECKPDFQQLEEDFRPFIREQVRAFGEFPTSEYHFLFQVLPYRTFHGVEHEHSTVIVLGPSPRVMKGKGYEELVAVSSHELYHTWNVKRIRPQAMMPYDFTQENYTRLGYIMEGVTTYMGDKMLLRSGFYSAERYLEKLATLIQRHFDNPGRHNLSVADSSFDTWLDGYDRDVPGRKVSIYNEGALIAFILDVRILEASEGRYSLDDLMRKLYEEQWKEGKGFTETGLQAAIKDLAGDGLEDVFDQYIAGTKDLAPLLEHCLEHLGIGWKRDPSELEHEARLGFRVRNEDGKPKVLGILPSSPAERGGMSVRDRIIAVNGYETGAEDLSDWCAYFEDEELRLTISRNGKLITRNLSPGKGPFYQRHRLELKEAGKNFEGWKA